MIYVYLFILYTLTSSNAIETIIINTTNGPIEGKISYNGRVREFLSIPYAIPPVGDLRWRNPTTITTNRTEIYNATIEPWGCAEHCSCKSPVPIQGICPPYSKEDCSILSIFTPNKDPPSLSNGYSIMIFMVVDGCKIMVVVPD